MVKKDMYKNCRPFMYFQSVSEVVVFDIDVIRTS